MRIYVGLQKNNQRFTGDLAKMYSCSGDLLFTWGGFGKNELTAAFLLLGYKKN